MTKKKLSGQNSAGKVIICTQVHCVLQTSGYPVDIPYWSSQSEHMKMDIHWVWYILNMYIIDVDILDKKIRCDSAPRACILEQ